MRRYTVTIVRVIEIEANNIDNAIYKVRVRKGAAGKTLTYAAVIRNGNGKAHHVNLHY